MNEEEIRVTPVFKSLVRPQLLAGGDRSLVIVLLVFSALLIGPGGLGSGSVLNFCIGILVLFVGLRVLNKIAKFDPYAMQIFKRATRYKDTYTAISGLDYKPQSPKK